MTYVPGELAVKEVTMSAADGSRRTVAARKLDASAARQAGGSLFFDVASPSRHPLAYRFAVGLSLVVFGACLLIGGYRLIFGVTV